MLRELIAQVAGEFVNSDGTFRAAGKVMDEAQCLYFLMGEDAKILGYGAVKSESEEELTLPSLPEVRPLSGLGRASY